MLCLPVAIGCGWSSHPGLGSEAIRGWALLGWAGWAAFRDGNNPHAGQAQLERDQVTTVLGNISYKLKVRLLCR